jgi:lipopolysaccharide export LptBFGC system permease protein LptF
MNDVRIGFIFLPIGSILDRYLAAGFVRIFMLSLAIITSLYITVDFFDRLATLLNAGAPMH